MDIQEDFGLEFLDLTDVDEYEKNRVLSSLQPMRINTTFPWFIGENTEGNGGLKSTKPAPGNLPHPVIRNHNFVMAGPKTARAPITIVSPGNGLAMPLNNKPQPVSQTQISPNPINNPVNESVSSQLNTQFYNTIPQYYNSPTVVPSPPNVPVHINYTSELASNTAMYPSYIPPTYPIKAPVYYGVPPAQPIFVSHPQTADTGNYYQNSSSSYVENNSIPVELATTSSVSQEFSLHDEQWKDNKNVLSNNDPSAVDSSPIQKQNLSSKKPVSPLSADTPAFTPKSHQSIPVEIENTPKSQPIEPQKQVSEPQNVESIARLPESLAPDQIIAGKQDSTPRSGGVWGAGKSWASLFTPKEGAMNSPEVNGMTKLAFPVAGKTESNNNEVSCPIKNPKRNHFIDPDCYRMGEFLTNYTVDGRAISIQPRGLINQSNYCYINSILQALIACPPMFNLLSGLAENISSNAKRKPTPVIDGMCKFVKEYKHLPANMRVSNRRSDSGKKDQKKDQGIMINTDIPFEPSWIYKILHGLQTDLMEGRQEDAEEFLGCILNHLSDEMLELMKLVETSDKGPRQELEGEEETWQVMGNKNKGSILRKTEFERTPITDIFGGSLKSRIQRIGGLSTENTQPFLTLPLNIEKVKTVREALEALTTKYQLEGLTSAKTNEQVEAWQQVMLDELPVVLVLHLKCFDFKLDGCTKIVKALEFPIDLKIDGKLISSKTTNAKEKQYKLFAVVYHDGKEASKGHYVTDAFHVGYSSWLRYDDAAVKSVQEEQVLNPQGTSVPYLLFYRRSDTIRSR